METEKIINKTKYHFDSITQTYLPTIDKDLLPMSETDMRMRLDCFAIMRLEYIKDNRPDIYYLKLSGGTLYDELLSIQEEAEELYHQLTTSYRKQTTAETTTFLQNVMICENADQFARETINQEIIQRSVTMM